MSFWPYEAKLIIRFTSITFKTFFIYHAVTLIGFDVRQTYGISMVPTISRTGEWILLNKQYRRGRGVEVGDIVSFWNPYKLNETAIKRVVGLPGDFVLRDTPGRGEGRMVQVPQGHCWLAGDNQQWSRDSRIYGPIPLALVRGKATHRFTAFLPPRLKRFEDGLQEPEMAST